MILLLGALGDAIINAPRRNWYYDSLTRRYFVLVQLKDKKPDGVREVLRRGEVASLAFETGALIDPR